MEVRNNWLYTPLHDFIFILAPPFVVLFILFLLPSGLLQSQDLTDYQWLWLVLAVDVAHVYSTLFRTYFDKDERKYYGNMFWLIPFVCFAAGIFLYALSDHVFWRVLAYLAVFHFIRQQYGFMRLYSRGEDQKIADIKSAFIKKFDAVVIYILTLYPIWYWHTHNRNFVWFTDSDFFQVDFNDYRVPFFIYITSIILYICKELWGLLKTKQLNVGRNLIVLGTGLSWYFGIVYFNGDLAFTALNVVSHGIPYMALIWFYKKKENKSQTLLTKTILLRWGWTVLILCVLIFAYAEEALWNGLVWQEHQAIFPFIKVFSEFDFTGHFVWLVPLLSLPQTTHYVLDGFIWKKKRDSKV